MTKGRLVLPSPFQGGVGPAHHRRATPDLHRRDRSHRGAGGVGARAEGLAPVQPVHVTKREDPADRGDHVWMWAGGDLPAAHARPRDRDLGLLRLDHQRNPGAVLPSRVKEIGITGSFFMSPSAWRRLCSCAGRPKRGAFPRCARRGRHDRRDLHRDALRAPSPNTNQLCVLWGGGRPADRIPFRANSFTRTPDDFGQTVAPPQTPPLQTARARNSDSHRCGGDRTAGRRPLRRVVLTCSLVPDCVCLGPYLLT